MAINHVVIVGNLCRDVELRSTPSGTSIAKLRVAVNNRRKDASGEWVDQPNYFDVVVWGSQGERCAERLSKGSQIAISGRLSWREWQTSDGSKRQAVEIVAEQVQFIGPREAAPEPVYADGSGARSDGKAGSDDEIPF